MEMLPLEPMGRVRRIILSPSFWLVVAMFLSALLLHYSAQLRALPIMIDAQGQPQLTRHSTERVLLILPIGYAAFALGPGVGLVALGFAFVIMLPRVIFLSPSPTDAFIEMTSVTLVGGLTIWLAWIKRSQEILRDKAAARLQAVNAVSGVLTGSLELRRMLGEALDAVLEVTGLEAGLIFVLDEKGEDLILAAHRGLPPGLTMNRKGLGLARMLVADRALASQVALLLKSKGRPQGALIVGRSGAHRFVPEEVDLLTAIATQIGVAADNARLHQDVARQLRRERRLGQIAKEITSKLELDEVLSKVVQIAEELVGADAGAIALLDEERKVITYPYLHNLPKELSQVTVSPGEGLAGQVTTTGMPAVLVDYQAYPASVADVCRGGIKSALGVPIISGEKVFGALDLFTLKEKRTFSDRDVSVVCGVAREAAIAIENARLYESMRSYARQILTAQERERRRMARELHDDTAQDLVALSRGLDTLLKSDDRMPERAKKRLEQLRHLTAEITHDVRRFSQDLRPSTLDDLGLLPTLEGLTARLSDEDGIEARLEILGDQRRLSLRRELVLFRIAQEALNNVRKHAQATRVETKVEFGDGTVRLTISDNGRGFKVPDRPGDLVNVGKLGLTGMLERAQLAGGTLTVRSKPGEGTTVVAQIPSQS
jgi:two-component system sensor histidine kinase DegS